ncbi:hypothetical protein F5Y17DRAFT_231023 [Xylariaceae sp. FL0594]|nr:hypothetical protein F5Y17DRAFT_231023 [Xylariaceae sp. FL0594]
MARPKLPTITLDTTLTDLYRRAGPRYRDKKVAQVMCPVNSVIRLSKHIPRNEKYLYQDSVFNECSREDGTIDLSPQSEREWAMTYIALAPQRDAFLSGDTTVVMFYVSGDSEAQQAHDREETEKTMSVLPGAQKPKFVFCLGPGDIPVQENEIDLLAYKLASDALEGYDLTVPLNLGWYINAKEALALSDLPTPRCELIKVEGHGNIPCCEICRKRESFVIPLGCTGERGRWFEKQSSRIIQKLSSHALPFVFKNQQAYGGAGTYIIRNEEDRAKLLQQQKNGALRRLLSYINEHNQHLGPATIILSEYVENEVGNYGLSFFVTEDADAPIFLAVTEQILLHGKHYIGSSIQYDRQEGLKGKFGGLVKDMARWYRRHGYVGPVGVDVLETASSGSDGKHIRGEAGADMQNGEQDGSGEDPAVEIGKPKPKFHVLDLNARTSGQLCLPLLRTHFTSRGLDCAASFFMRILKRRDDFIKLFEREFETGKMCILSWYDDPESEISFGNVVIGAEDIERLAVWMQRIRGISEEVKF